MQALVHVDLLEPRKLLSVAPVFNFTLADTEMTSAGVYKTDGTLVRTLWSGVEYDAGTHTKTWDGLDDWGNRVADDDYNIKVVSNQVTYTWEGVVGNSSLSQTDTTVYRGYDSIGALAIVGSKAFFGHGYPEAGTTSGRFDVDAPNSSRTPIHEKGGDTWYVAADATNVYWAGQDYNNYYTYIWSTKVSDDTQVTFADGAGYTPTWGKPLTSVINMHTDGHKVSGVAVQQSGNFLFVARATLNEVDVVNKTTGALVNTISMNGVRGLAVDGSDNVWLSMMNGSTPEVRQYSVNASTGAFTYVKTAAGTFSSPLAMAVSPDGAMLLVVDGGASQQIKAFTVSTGAVRTSFGASGVLGQLGGYATDPNVADDKFYFEITGPQGTKPYAGIAFESDGTFWVTDAGNDRVQHFAANTTFIDRIEYLSASYNSSIDHNDPTRLWSDFKEYAIDYSKPLSPTNGSWTMVRNWEKLAPAGYGTTYRKFYPQTLSNGRTYALLQRAVDNKLELFEMTPGHTLRNTGIVTTASNTLLQPDGSLRSVNAPAVGGTITWKQQALTGFDGSHNPIYGTETVLATTKAEATDPAWWGDLTGIRAGIQTTGDILISYDRANESGDRGTGYHLGAVRIGDDKWLWRTSMATHNNYDGPYPTDGSFDIGNSVRNPGSVAMTLEDNVFWGYYGEFYNNSQTNKFAHYTEDGLLVNTWGTVGSEIINTAYAPEGHAGNAINPWVVRAPNGEAYLYHNDESLHAGVHRWHIDGLDTIQEQNVAVTLNVGAAAGLRGEYFDTSELSSFDSKTVRTDGTVNFSWGTGIPSGTGLTAGTTYSVRWEGFVEPLHSETYTFYANTSAGARLWVNGKLIVDQWSTPGEVSGTIALKKDTPYKIRLEVRHETGSNSVSLSWSSTSQAKQVIPQNRLSWLDHLYPAPTTPRINLLEKLNFDTTVNNDVYGWHRDGAVDTNVTTAPVDKWQVTTNRYIHLKDEPDINVFYERKNSGSVSTLSRDLGTPSNSTVHWSLAGDINFKRNSPNHGAQGGQYIDVLDDAGKLITRFYLLQHTYPNDTRIVANQQVMASMAFPALQTYTQQWRPFEISANNGTITFTYGDYTLSTATLADPTADWRRATTLRMYYFTGNTSYGRGVSFKNLTYVAAALPAAPGGLNATPASTSSINLSWTDNSNNEAGFEIDRATNASFTAGLVTMNAGMNATSFVDAGLSPNTTYYYRVRATNLAGDSSNTSTASATTFTSYIFFADFDGSGNGTGGTTNFVEYGGTGAYASGSAGNTMSIESSPAMEGNFLRSDVTASSATRKVLFTPASAANSWEALSTKPGSHWLLNGGFSFFWRSNSSSINHRPLDFSNRNTGGWRFALQLTQSQMKLSLTPPAGAPGTSEWNTSSATTFSKDQIYHIGVTMNTDPSTGVVTVRYFKKAGTGAIDTTSATDRIAQGTFQPDEAYVTLPFINGAFEFGGIFADGYAKQNDMDSFRIWAADPSSFPELNEGSGMLLMMPPGESGSSPESAAMRAPSASLPSRSAANPKFSYNRLFAPPNLRDGGVLFGVQRSSILTDDDSDTLASAVDQLL